MTSEQDNERHPTQATDADEHLRLRCMQYLLGELPTTELAAFEQELAQSPQLGRELLAQSELICSIASPVSVSSPPHRSTRVWRVAALISALAASLLIALVGLRWLQEDEREIAGVNSAIDQANDEHLLIARAWAADHLSLGLPDLEVVLRESEFDIKTEEPKDDDSVLSWMVAAVADVPDLPVSDSGGTTDG